MFLLFEMDIPNGVPQHYIYVPIPNSTIENQNDTSLNTNLRIGLEQDTPPPNSESSFDQNNQSEFSEPSVPDQPQQQSPSTPPPPDPKEIAYQQELEPLKKLYLLQKISKLRDALEENNYNNSQLTLILKYGANLSYESLLKLSERIILSLQKEFRLKNLKFSTDNNQDLEGTSSQGEQNLENE